MKKIDSIDRTGYDPPPMFPNSFYPNFYELKWVNGVARSYDGEYFIYVDNFHWYVVVGRF